MKIGNLTLAERIVINFQRAGIKDIAVVTGALAGQVEKSLHRFGVAFLKNENYMSAMIYRISQQVKEDPALVFLNTEQNIISYKEY